MPLRAIVLASAFAVIIAAVVGRYSPAAETLASLSQEQTTLECSANKSSISDGGIVTITAVLVTDGGLPIEGQTIQWTDDPDLWHVDETSSITDSDGEATVTYSLIFDTGFVGTETVTATFAGTEEYAPSSCEAMFSITSTCPDDICGTDFDFNQGDNNCDGAIDVDDALASLRHDAGLEYHQNSGCLPIGLKTLINIRAVHPAGIKYIRVGDVDCDEGVDPVDALNVLRFIAGLSVHQNEPCPAIGNPF